MTQQKVLWIFHNMITPSEKKAAFKRLPEKLQDLICSDEIIEKVDLISDKFNLSDDQKDSLSNEITLVMLGLQDDSGFIKKLQENVGPNGNTAMAINHEVADSIFAKIRELIPSVKNNNKSYIESPKITVSNNANKETSVQKSALLPGINLIEDSKGNADNVLPPLPEEKGVTQAPEVPRSIEIKQTVPNTPHITQQKPEPTLTDAEWEARKKALEAGELVMKTAYGSKPDPYREAI
ncbi:hypothetical protein K2X05_02925 [bacterium]|nr:hypothetical protein [bacterium]